MPHQGNPVFRCKTCGHLESAEHAGEDHLPHACSVCGNGVIFAQSREDVIAKHPPATVLSAEEFEDRVVLAPPWGVKFLVFENWEVLADATPERHEELGVDLATVTRHEPKGRKRGARFGRAVERTLEDGPKARDTVG